MDNVWIAHPRLPDNPPVEVPASALAEHQRAGWEETDAPPPPPLPDPGDPDPGDDDKTADQTTEAPADAGASALEDQSPRRRRASTKEDE